MGVAMAMASMSLARVRSSTEEEASTSGQSRFTASSRAGFRSTIRTSSLSGHRWKLRARFGPQYPYPISPTLVILLSLYSLRNPALRQVEHPPGEQEDNNA